MIKIQYFDEVERERHINQYTSEGLSLLEEMNVVDGNYLIFGEPKSHPPSEIEELTNYVLDVDFRLLMVEMGLM